MDSGTLYVSGVKYELRLLMEKLKIVKDIIMFVIKRCLTKINIKNLQGSEFITNFAVLKVKQ